MLVTVSGQAGTGTTTLARLLSARLNLPHVYAGAIFRDMAKERSMSLAEFGRYAESHPEVDMELDERMVDVASREHAVLEGRLAAWHALRAEADALTVLLRAPLDVRAQRVAKREGNRNLETVQEEIEAREASERTRYRDLYDVDVLDTDLYDLIVDTEDKTPEEIAEIVLSHLPDDAGA